MKLVLFTVDFDEYLIEAYDKNKRRFFLIKVQKEFIEDNLFYMRQKVKIRRKYLIGGDFILRLEGQKAKYKCAFLKITKAEDVSSALLKLNE